MSYVCSAKKDHVRSLNILLFGRNKTSARHISQLMKQEEYRKAYKELTGKEYTEPKEN